MGQMKTCIKFTNIYNKNRVKSCSVKPKILEMSSS